MKKSKIALLVAATLVAGSAMATSSENVANVNQTGSANNALVTQVEQSNQNNAGSARLVTATTL